MGITDRDRKRLWGKSGNRCAKCNHLLTHPGQSTSRETVVGEEAHIIGAQPGAARYQSLPRSERDAYENMILLCRNDHVVIDEQPEHWTVEKLHALKDEHEQRMTAQTAEVDLTLADVPQLSFGRAVIPQKSQPIVLFSSELRGEPRRLGIGRVIRVPVGNVQGAGDAKHVHAQLTFLPRDRNGLYSPTHAAQGEWFSESGNELEIDLLGNGRMRLLDIILVWDGQYPYAHEWTTASRGASLHGYAIKANPIEVDIEVMGSGSKPYLPRLRDRLIIRLDRGMIVADWASAGADAPTNWVAWDGYYRGTV